MKTTHFARSAMLTEYLRYVWSRPVPLRIPVKEVAPLFSPAAPVAVKSFTKQRRLLDRNLWAVPGAKNLLAISPYSASAIVPRNRFGGDFHR